ncbi:MAG: 23S rRNA (guanosine(2251)-2'-O)-methyltransferase RlmB [Pseudomonadota bacterium]
MSDVFGFQAVRAVLNDTPERGRQLFVQTGRREARANEIIALAKARGIRFQSKEGRWFKDRLGDATHQGILLECHGLAITTESDFFSDWAALGADPIILLLDGVTDPRNFGACLRTANGAGVAAVIFPKRNSAPLNSVALKTAQGGAETLRLVEVTNLNRCIKNLQKQGVWVIGADDSTKTVHFKMDAKGPLAIAMGSEGKGLRRLTKEACDQLVKIPMLGSVSSLNVSVATGVILYECIRQRDMPAGPQVHGP